ncbi:MAG TPA: hypothetical protein VN063_03845 [Methylophilaceae bacterium]|nr:hypothetical protein [Methylophilaceae bacterium]
MPESIMTLARALVVLLLLTLSFTALAQYTEQEPTQGQEQSLLADVDSIQSSSDCDLSDIGLLPGRRPGVHLPRIKACASLDKVYRQLAISPPFKPPVA